MSKKRLLIIEDDVDVADMLVTFFDGQGYEVFQADTGSDGVEIARTRFPNLILLDVMLPDMEGFEVCEQLRTTTLTKYIPITFLTQRDARADKVAGLQLGADDYVTKPFDIEELRLRVQGSIRRATRDHLHEPRTGLPTGRLLKDEYERLRDQEGWHYYKLTPIGFLEFRDIYGFIVGDEAIALGAKVITQSIADLGTPDDFIGITENNSYVLFTHAAESEQLVNRIKETFGQQVHSLYSFMDVEQGYILANEGTPEEKQVPLMHFDVAPYTED